jgi:hypothetical protein
MAKPVVLKERDKRTLMMAADVFMGVSTLGPVTRHGERFRLRRGSVLGHASPG